jgi:hypothetical protein
MKALPVAPPVAPSGRVASLLTFYRDVLDRLALYRLTERDPEVMECVERVHDDLLGRCALLTRKMRAAGLLDGGAKIVGLHPVDNRVNNRPSSRSL